MTESMRRALIWGTVAILAGCAAQPPVGEPTIVSRTADALVVRTATDRDFESLAAEYLGSPKHAAQLAADNPHALDGQLAAGQLAVIPLRDANPAGVYVDGYRTVPILCYHRFSRTASTDAMTVSADDFAEQMAYLADNGYSVIRLTELTEFLNGTGLLPPKPVVITIDDGFRSVRDIAYPILEARGFPATLFVYTDFVGGAIAARWADIQAFDASGLMDIQSHSKSHQSLAQDLHESDADYSTRVALEVDGAERALQSRLGGRVQQFAFPYGDASEAAVAVLEARGYGLAATVRRGTNPSFQHPLLLNRSMVFGEDDLATFVRQLESYQTVDLR